MSLSFKGDFAAVNQFATKLRLAGSTVKGAQAKMAERARVLLNESYGARRDPYGKKWKRRKMAYAWPLLEKTGKLRASVKVSSSGRTITFSYGTSYGRYQHPVRNIIPSKAGGLPARWRRDFEQIIKLELKRALA